MQRKRDVVTHEFGRTDLDELDIMDLAEAVYSNNLSQVIDVISDIARSEHNKGFENA